MSKHDEDGGFQRRGGMRGGSDHQAGPQGGAVGKGAATDRRPGSSPAATIVGRLRAAEAVLASVGVRYLPAMRTAIDAREMPAARAASADLRIALLRIDDELANARRWATVSESEGALSLIAPLEAQRDARRAEAALLLALAPPPAPAVSAESAFQFATPPAELAAYEEGEAANRAQWDAQLDAREAEAPADNVIDASDRFTAARAEPASEAPVQRRVVGYPTENIDLPSVAAAGVAGGGGRIPHFAAIQRSFGAHDVSGVQAHVGGGAADAASAIGAEAYATGNHVAFAEQPSLFVAAHEAAHVVQQRAGVSLLGGVGEAGDGYEQHADAVAHAVVRGESAEGLLGEVREGAGGGAVQRKENGDDLAVNMARKWMGHDRSGGGSRPVQEPNSEEREEARSKQREMMTVDDQLKPLMFAELAARRTLEALRGDDLVVAMQAGVEGCDAITRHLKNLLVAPKFGAWRLAGVCGLVYQVAAAMDRLWIVELSAVSEMRDAIANAQSVFPAEDVPAIASEGEAEELGKGLPQPRSGASVLASAMRSIPVDLDRAVELYRAALNETMEADTKQAFLIGTLVSVMGQVAYVSDTARRNEIGAELDDPTLVETTETLRSVAQRFVYCAMHEPALPDTAAMLAEGLAPLFEAVGVSPLLVESGAPEEGDEKGAVDRAAQNLRRHWERIYEAKDTALTQLLSQPDEPESEPSGWDQVAMTLLAASTFNWAIGLVAGAAGVVAEDRVRGSKVGRGAIKTATSDVIKGVARTVFEAKFSSAGTDLKGPRHQFFSEQQLALVDVKARHLALLEEREITEAQESPEGRAALKQQMEGTEPAAAKIAEKYKARAVQDWAIHMAMHAYGQDTATGGVNLDQVGGFTGLPEAAADHERGIGVLEVVVEIGAAGTKPKVIRAAIEGLSEGDRAHISNLTLGELQLPIQIRAFTDGDVDVMGLTGAPSFLVSRNREGKIWLSEVSDRGREWLGLYELAGAAAVFSSLAGESVGAVESE